jgi:hypothetical protein
MNIDTINHTDIAYSTSITDVLKGYQDLILDPFIHVKTLFLVFAIAVDDAL